MRPYALRPPVRGLGLVSDFSGLSRVTSAKSETVWNRRPALVGLRLRIGIPSAPEDLDAVALGEGHDGALLAGADAPRPGLAVALALPRPVERVHVRDPHVEDRLDRLLDLDLVGVRRDDERVDVLVVGRVGLLRHDRLEDHVTRVALAHANPPLSALRAGPLGPRSRSE